MKSIFAAALCAALCSPALADPTPAEQIAPPLSPMERLLDAQQGEAVSQTCCKMCRKGKACGNSCISRTYTCRKGNGCACNG